MGRLRPSFGAGSRPSWVKIAFAAVVPLAVVLLGAAVLRGGGSGAPVHREALETGPGAGCIGLGCAEGAAGAADGVGGGAAALTAPLAVDASHLEPLFLFVGILSGRGYRHRRLAVREAWSNSAQRAPLVVAKFILSEDERTPQVQKELEMYGDIVFAREKTNYKSILYKTFFVLEYAVRQYNVKFVLKTDDDAFININPMIEQLRALCENKDCERERLYMGKMARHSEVLLQPGHKWNNAAFHNHTGLRTYPNYMMGGGYVISGEVCRVLVDVHARMHLKFTPIEDATLGFWLMAMDLRHIDHPRFYTWAAPCCFKPPVRRLGQRLGTRFQLVEEYEKELCSADPWLILHKIDSPTKMRYVGARVANCSSEEQIYALAPSIEAHVPAENRAYYLQLRAQQQQQQHLGQEQQQQQQSPAQSGQEPEASSLPGAARDSGAAVDATTQQQGVQVLGATVTV